MNDLVSQYFTCSKPVKEYNTVEPKKDIKNKDGININLFLYNSITKIEIKMCFYLRLFFPLYFQEI